MFTMSFYLAAVFLTVLYVFGRFLIQLARSNIQLTSGLTFCAIAIHFYRLCVNIVYTFFVLLFVIIGLKEPVLL